MPPTVVGHPPTLYSASMVRSLFATGMVVFLTLLFGVPALVLSLLFPRGEWVLRLGRPWARGICAAAGVSVEARGAENVPADRPVLLLANHQSNFDVVALVLTIPVSFRVVAKRLLCRIPIFGWCLSLAGMIPIDRAKRAQAIQSLEQAAERVRHGKPVLLFPEGTRSRDGALLPFKKGAFVIAQTSGVPIVPVSITGSHSILRKGSILPRPGHIVVRYGREIPPAGPGTAERERLMEMVRGAIQSGLGEEGGAPALTGDALGRPGSRQQRGGA